MRAHSYQAGGSTVNQIADQPGQRGPGAGIMVLGLTLAVAVAAPALDRGGFTAASQRLLLILVAVALLEVVLLVPRRLTGAIRVPAIPVLFVLGGLPVLSAAW